MKIRFKKLHHLAQIPRQATSGSAGFDLTAVTCKYGDNGKVFYDTGIAVEIPAGYVGLVFQRSSVHKTGLTLSCCVGVIDSDFRSSISMIFNVGYGGCSPYQVGDRIGQLVIVQNPQIEFVESDELSDTKRGFGGYGSTGR